MKRYKTKKKKLLLSIIVPIYNMDKYIIKTLRSLRYISKKISCEIIIQNSLSTDKTTSIIDNYIKKEKLKNFYHYCEKDKGQSNGINKGIQKARGEWVTWLCGDDLLRKEFLLIFNSKLLNKYDVIYGDVVFYNGKDYFPAIGTEDYSIGKLIRKRLFIQQPGTIIRKSFWDKVGGLNEKLNFHMDYDLFIRLEIKKARFLRYKSFIATALLRKDAKTSSSSISRLIEYYYLFTRYHFKFIRYFSIRPYLVYTLEYILKNIEQYLYKRNSALLTLLHKYLTNLFWKLAIPNEKLKIESRFSKINL